MSRPQLEPRRARRPQAPFVGRVPGEAHHTDAPIGAVGTAADRRKWQSRRLCLWHDSRRMKRHGRWHWKWHQWHRKGPWCRKWHGRRRRKRHGRWRRKWHGRRRRKRHGRWRWRPLALKVLGTESGTSAVSSCQEMSMKLLSPSRAHKTRDEREATISGDPGAVGTGSGTSFGAGSGTAIGSRSGTIAGAGSGTAVGTGGGMRVGAGRGTGVGSFSQCTR
jgi:hypothetical protein